MKNIKYLLTVITIALFICGCDFGKEAREQALKTMTSDIVNVMLNDYIQKNSEWRHYKISENEIFSINDGIVSETMYNYGKNFQIFEFAKKYDYGRWQIKLEKIDYNFENKYTCYVTWSLTVTSTMAQGVPGITINAIPPVPFNSMSNSQKTDFIDKYHKELLTYHYDYHYINNHPEASTSLFSPKQAVFTYNKKKDKWECDVPEYQNYNGHLNVLPMDWNSEQYNKKNAAAALRKKGFLPYKKYYLQNDSMQIIKNIDNGFVLLNGKWFQEEIYNNSITLINEFSSNNNFNANSDVKNFSYAVDNLLNKLNSTKNTVKNTLIPQIDKCIHDYINAENRTIDDYEFMLNKLSQNSWEIFSVQKYTPICKNNILKLYINYTRKYDKYFTQNLTAALNAVNKYSDEQDKKGYIDQLNANLLEYCKKIKYLDDFTKLYDTISSNESLQVLDIDGAKKLIVDILKNSIDYYMKKNFNANNMHEVFNVYNKWINSKFADQLTPVMVPYIDKLLQNRINVMNNIRKNAYAWYKSTSSHNKIDAFKKIKQNCIDAFIASIPEIQQFILAMELISFHNIKYNYNEVMNDPFKSMFFEKCYSKKCDRGRYFCTICNNTKICINCKGHGYLTIESFNGGKRQISCPSQCSSCAKIFARDGKCTVCKGKGYRLRKKQTGLKNLFNKFISAVDSEIAKDKKILSDIEK